jgi:hypothetical protein
LAGVPDMTQRRSAQSARIALALCARGSAAHTQQCTSQAVHMQGRARVSHAQYYLHTL